MENFIYDIPSTSNVCYSSSSSNAGAEQPLGNSAFGFSNYTNLTSTANAGRRVSPSLSAGAPQPLMNLPNIPSTANAGAEQPLVNFAVLDGQVEHFKKLANMQRKAAVNFPAKRLWYGEFHRQTKPIPDYSLKVFVGGMPWNVPEGELMQIFSAFGQCRIEWPKSGPIRASHIYVIYSWSRDVRMLLGRCKKINGDFFHEIRDRQVQVIPFDKDDRYYFSPKPAVPEPHLTVFVGNLRGSITATGLAGVMEICFGEVVSIVYDVDECYGYPTGSARVAFCSPKSFDTAIKTAVLEIKTNNFTQKVQIDPYIRRSVCSYCFAEWGPIFCRSLKCFRYSCLACWILVHATTSDGGLHLPMILQCTVDNSM